MPPLLGLAVLRIFFLKETFFLKNFFLKRSLFMQYSLFSILVKIPETLILSNLICKYALDYR